MTTKFLIIGSGTREHAIAKALHRSRHQPVLYCCGVTRNPGIDQLTKHYWVGDIHDVEAVLALAERWQIDIVIIGPVAPLANGLADALWKAGIATIGPKKNLAQIETNTFFPHRLLKKLHPKNLIEQRIFKEPYGIREYLEHLGSNQYVIKSNSGQRVKIGGEHLHSFNESVQYCEALSAAGHAVMIQEKIIGQEFTLTCFCDGNRLVPVPLMQTLQRVYVDDEGPHTGGMGCYSFANHRLPFLSETDYETALHVNEAVITALTYEYQEPYMGFISGNFMATKKGIQLVKLAARLGDPEALNILALLATDFVEICEAMVSGTLTRELVAFEKKATVSKCIVPEGYPDNVIGQAILDVSRLQDATSLYLGAVSIEEGKFYTTGGRAAAIVGMAESIVAAEKNTEDLVRLIKGPFFHREDIGTVELINRYIKQMQELRQRDYRLL